MYSQGVELLKNDIRGQRGPSGYALGFKDANDVVARDNLLVDNRMGIFLDGTPYTLGNYARIEENIIAYNDIGVGLVTTARGATFSGNTFWENEEQVSLQVGGIEGNAVWDGNYWSEYAGFDADGDGLGDIPYHSDRFFESLTDRDPLLRALNFSPAVQAIEFAATSFPIFKPQPKLTDRKPLAYPADIPNSAEKTHNQRATMALLGLGLLAISAFGVRLVVKNEGGKMPSLEATKQRVKDPEQQREIKSSDLQSGDAYTDNLVLYIDKVTKRYGKVLALNEAQLEVYLGQSIALWGANGAGKTTLLKAILNLIDYKGAIYVNGNHTRKNGKAARKSIGYVPQEVAYYDMSVLATLRFYARLKRVDPARIPVLVDKVGLGEHVNKPVPALSGGLKQRLALAIALLSDPPLLLFDEPTANLDVQGRRDYLALLAMLRKEKKTILFASHRLEEVEILADRVIMMEAGRIVDEIEPSSLRSQLDSDIELILWLPDEQRRNALNLLENRGVPVHLNGRGTLVALIKADQKLQLLNLLADKGIQVLNFEIEEG